MRFFPARSIMLYGLSSRLALPAQANGAAGPDTNRFGPRNCVVSTEHAEPAP